MSNFSKYTWDLYRKSPDGKKALKKSLAQFAAPLLGKPEDDVFAQVLYATQEAESTSGTIEVHGDIFFAAYVDSSTAVTVTLKQVRDLFEEIADNGLEVSEIVSDVATQLIFNRGDKPNYASIYTEIHSISAGFHMAFPEAFAPFFFGRNFDLFTDICHQFGIFLPELPRKLKKRERAMYYLAINAALQRFREANALSPEEFNAFLYDFAIKDRQQRVKKQSKTPPASRVWFVIGGAGGASDHEYVIEPARMQSPFGKETLTPGLTTLS